jgi:hypothetical protein
LITIFCLVQNSMFSQIPFLPPDSLKASQQCDYIYLSWQAPGQNTDEIIGYNVYLEDSLLTFTPDTLYQIQKQGFGYVTFNVTTVYDLGESTPAGIEVELVIYAPATNLVYDEDQCRFTWSAPEGNWPISINIDEEIFQWCDNYNDQSIGTGGPVEFDVAAVWTPGYLNAYDEGDLYLKSLDFYPGESTASYTVMIWTGTSSESPDMLIYSKEVTDFATDEWNTVILEDSILVDIQHYLWIGYHVNTPTGYPAGVDNGPAIDGLGNMMNFGGWQTLLEINPDLDCNWNIKANLTYYYNSTELFYNLYGFWGCENWWDEWVKLNDYPITDTSYFYACALPFNDHAQNDCFVQVMYCGVPINSDTSEYNICWWSGTDQLKDENDRFLVINSDGQWKIQSEYMITSLMILDLTGKIIYKNQDEFYEKMISCNTFPPGVYILQGFSNKEIFTRKIVR